MKHNPILAIGFCGFSKKMNGVKRNDVKTLEEIRRNMLANNVGSSPVGCCWIQSFNLLLGIAKTKSAKTLLDSLGEFGHIWRFREMVVPPSHL